MDHRMFEVYLRHAEETPINDVHQSNDEYSQTYQLLLPDGSQQDFSVVGVSE